MNIKNRLSLVFFLVANVLAANSFADFETATGTSISQDDATLIITVQAADPNICYAVADAPNPDKLVTINRTSGAGAVNVAGTDTGRNNIEAMTLSLDGNTLYAADAGQFGTINSSTEAWTSIGSGFGSGTGDQGTLSFSDVDGLAIDPRAGIFYGSQRESAAEDLLFQINPTTGAHIANAYNDVSAGYDYVTIDTSSLGFTVNDIDDLAIDPNDGQLYGVANNGGGSDRLVKIDKTTGSVTDIGRLRLSIGTGINDFEALSFFNDGALYAATGSGTEALWSVDKTTGIVTKVADFGINDDYEAIGCLTAGANTISGKVFEDDNFNGVFDGTDSGTQSVLVSLYIDVNNSGTVDGGDTLVQTEVTDSSGDYEFEVAIANDFVIEIDETDLPAEYNLSTDNVEEADFTDYGNTDTDNNFGWRTCPEDYIYNTATVSGDATDSVPSNNTSNICTTVLNVFDISGVIYNDVDGDGDLDDRLSQSGTETALAGPSITVTLYEDDGTGNPGAFVASVVTTDGTYEFLGQPPDDYVIVTTTPAGYTSTNDVSGANDDKILVSLTNADVDKQDFLDALDNVAQVGDVKGRVINDVDGDGDLAERFSEAGLAGVTVQLWIDSDGNGTADSLYDTTTTNGNGEYSFTNTPPGTYVVIQDGELSGFTSTNDITGPSDNLVTLTRVGTSDSNLNDFLDAQTPDLGSIGDTVYNDVNGNGQFDAGEGINGVTVWIDYDGDGVVDANEPSDVTAGDGAYLIEDLPVGNFSVKVLTSTLPGGLNQTIDPDAILDDQTLISLGPSGDNLTADFGYRDTGSIGDQIFEDLNMDGDWDSGEGIVNVVVYIDANNNGIRDPDELFAITDSNGNYLLDKLAAGTYDIKVDESTLPNGLANTVDPDGGFDSAAEVTIAAGEDSTITDFGYEQTGSASGRVYDSNGNSALPGVRVDLVSGGCTAGVDCDFVDTDADGNYSFDGLFDGNYTIVIDPNGDTLPSGATQTNDPDAMLDSETDITITGGNDIVDRDFGYSLPMYVLKEVDDAADDDDFNDSGNSVNPGDELEFRLTPSWEGTALLSNVLMSDLIPTGTTYVSDSDDPEVIAPGVEPPTGAPETISWDLGSNTPDVDGIAPGSILCPAFTKVIASRDTFLTSSATSDNHGGADKIRIDSNEVNDALFYFDVVAGLPAGAIITSAEFQVTVESGQDIDPTATVHQLNSIAWNEGGGAEGGDTCNTGDDAGLNGATWNQPQCSGTGWNGSSGNFSTASLGGSLGTIAPEIDEATYGVDVTSLAQSWLSTPATNFGLVMKANGTDDGTVKFHSRNIADKEPGLFIAYNTPSTTACSPTVRDEFTTESYSNQDGTALWDTDWVETGDDGDLTSGQIKVVDGADDSGYLYFKTKGTDSLNMTIEREADLSGPVTAASLSFRLVKNDFDGGEQAVIEASNDGGSTWPVTLFTINEESVTSELTNYGPIDMLTPLGTVSDQTRIRIRHSLADGDKELRLDNIQIGWTLTPGPGGTSSLAATPTLVKNGDTVNLTLSVSSTGELNNITPATPTVNTSVGGASCSSITAVDTSIKSIGSGGGTVTFTWTCTAVNSTTAAKASVDLTATATATDEYSQPAVFSAATSNNVLMPKPLQFSVIVDDPSIVEQVDNQGTLSDDNVMTSGVPSNQVTNPVNLNLDYGDLANTYGTTLASDGARHIISATSLGGATTDAETDGPASGDGTQDDTTGTDDEDGVTFGPLVQGETSTITVNSTGTGGTDYLNAWADWNHDGVFQEGEQIFSDQPLTSGDNTLNINVPPGATLGDTPIRFRVTDEAGQGGGSPTGLATTGEVEDHFATVQGLASGTDTIEGAVLNDTDGDGDLGDADLGIENVTVALYWDDDGNGRYDGTEPFVNSTQTATDGSYSFTGLSDLEYLVVESNPIGATSTNDKDGNGGDFSDNGFDVIAVDLSPDGNQAPDERDFLDNFDAEWAIGDRIWLDTDRDGIQDQAEPGLANITVYLCAEGVTPCNSGNALQETLTDANGNYLFTGEDTGGYYVTVNTSTLTNLKEAPGTPTNSVSDVITVSQSEEFFDVDFGYVGDDPDLISIGDRVWSDANADGIQDPGESGIGGVTVNLLDLEGNIVDTTTTGPSGQYLFTAITPGSYKVQVVDSGPLAGATPTDGPQSEGALISSARTGAPGDIITDLDFGFTVPSTVTIKDKVYFDTSGEGEYQPDGRDGDPLTTDDNEYGLPGVTVNLLDTNGDVVATTTTDENGDFEFTGVPAGADYSIEVADNTNELAGLTGTSLEATSYTLNLGTVSSNIDNTAEPTFGYNIPGGIGDTIYSDNDGDGVQDPGEIGIAGVVVILDDGICNPATTGQPDSCLRDTTDGSGGYLFEGQVSGTYTVTVAASNFSGGGALEGLINNLTGDPDEPGTCSTCDHQGTVPLASNSASYLDADFGYQNPSLPDVSGNVWNDINENGVLDAGEGVDNIAGVTVELIAPDGSVAGTTTTDSSGNYFFRDLPDGEYSVRVTDTHKALKGYLLTSGLDEIHFEMAGSPITDIDFGYARVQDTGSIGDRLWLDTDGDGIQGGSEAGLAGVTVYLCTSSPCDDTKDIAQAVTDADGNYQFTELVAGDYYVGVEQTTLPLNLIETTYPGGVDPSAMIALSEGETYTEADFGYVSGNAVASIGNTVWLDSDGDGIQDPGEPGLPGVTVQLLDSGGTPTGATAVTGPDGSYLFSGLSAGTYGVKVFSGLPSDLTSTTAGGDTQTGIVLSDGEQYLDADFGYTSDATDSVIGDFVWRDANGDGIQDAGETGIGGVLVNLLDEFGAPTGTSTTTNPDGSYLFTGLAPGDYQVEIDASNFTTGPLQTYSATSGADSTWGDNSGTITVAAGETRSDIDFSYDTTGNLYSISDTLWSDTDGDGVLDGGESGIEGVVITLLDGSGDPIATTTTDANGDFSFPGVPNGSYTIEITDTGDLLNGRATTTAPATAGELAVSVSGMNVSGENFGYIGGASLGDFVWYDVDGDGLQGAGELGIGGVDVIIIDQFTAEVIATVTTNSDGSWLATGLSPGDYAVYVDPDSLPTDVTQLPTNLNGGDTYLVSLQAGDTLTNIDFGYDGGVSGSIGDTVWLDTDGDGIQDAGEPGLAGREVYLMDLGPDGVPDTGDETRLGKTTTDLNGQYLFEGLLPGEYYIWTAEPGGLTNTNNVVGTDVIHTPIIEISGGERYESADFGFAPTSGTGVIGDRVWHDANNDQTEDPGEPGLGGVTVYLCLGDPPSATCNASSPDLVGTTTTDADGSYLFAGLAPTTGSETYAVQVDTTSLPSGYGNSVDVGDGTADGRTTLTLAADSVNDDLDFGYYNSGANGTVDGNVYRDLNGDSDPTGDPAIEGVTVSLINPGPDGLLGTLDDQVIATTTTDVSGDYSFDGLPLGTANDVYYVDITDIDGKLNGLMPTEISSGALDCSSSCTHTGVDFGYQPPTLTSSIGNTVWLDTNGNGEVDGDEAGMAGVTVYLCTSTPCDSGNAVETAVTSEDGSYVFDGLTAGTYYVGVESTDVTDLTGTTWPGNETDPIVLVSGETNRDADFGYQPTTGALIGDRIWNDANGNGVQDEGEAGIGGVTVELSDGSCTLGSTCDSVVTSADGSYLFTGVAAGTYDVVVDTTTGGLGSYTQTGDPDDPGPPACSSCDDQTSVTVADGDVITTADFGYQNLTSANGSIGDTVYNDTNGNGTQDPGEGGIAGVTVSVYDSSSGNLVGSAVTDVNGNYGITGLPAGSYNVEASDPNNVLAGQTAIEAPGNPVVITCPSGCDQVSDADFGFGIASGSIGDTVYFDADGSGGQNGNEPGIENVTVNLLDSGGNVIATQTTDANGAYDFSGLPPGDYTVEVSDLNDVLDGLTQSQDPTPAAVTITCDNANTPPCTDHNDADAGYESTTGGTGTLGGTIWRDTIKPDPDGPGGDDPIVGTLQEGEPGVEGVNVELWLDVDGDNIIEPGIDNLVRTTTTNANGDYLFLGIPPGDYFVRVPDDETENVDGELGTNGVIAGLESVEGPLPNEDSNGHVNPYKVTLPDDPGNVVTDTSIDFAYDVPTADPTYSISGTMFEDNGDDGTLGVFDPTSDPIADGATIRLYRVVNGVESLVGTTLTDGNGNYSFGDLPAGDYVVRADTSGTLVDGMQQSTDPDQYGSECTSCDSAFAVTLPYAPATNPDGTAATGGNVSGVHFGYWNGDVVTTPVTLSYFFAQSGENAGDVYFKWSTVTETGNVGFDLYLELDSGELVRINERMVPAKQGRPLEVRHYEYQVTGVSGNVFWIMDTDIFGIEKFHGPFQLDVPAGSAESASNPIDGKSIKEEHDAKKQLRKERKKDKMKQKLKKQKEKLKNNGRWSSAEEVQSHWTARLAGGVLSLMVGSAHAAELPVTDTGLIQMQVSESGIQRVTYEELVDAGLDLKGIDPDVIAVTVKGEPVALTVDRNSNDSNKSFGNGWYIEFFGQGLDTLYSKTNVYTIYLNESLAARVSRDRRKASRRATPVEFYNETVREEEENFWNASAPTDDPWFMEGLNAVNQPYTTDLTISIDNYAGDVAPVELAIDMWGATDFPDSLDDHHVVIALNGETVADELFDGLVDYPVSVAVSADVLLDGVNTLTFTAPLDTGNDFDVVNLNSYQITYPRHFISRDGGTFNFTGQGRLFEVKGLDSKEVIVYRIDANGSISVLSRVKSSEQLDGTFNARFPGTREVAEYHLVTLDALNSPQLESSPEELDITSGSASYLMIAHPDFIGPGADDEDALENLKLVREADGYSVKIVDLEQIYAQFGFGLTDPQAIRDYIAYAHANMGTTVVLLVGGDTLDYHGYLTPSFNAVSFVPSLYAQTGDYVYHAPVDPRYADVDGDDVPDLAIGRFPVRTSAELSILVEKTLAWQYRDYGNSALFAADSFDTGNHYNFKSDSETMLDSMPDEWKGQLTRAYIDDIGIAAARASIIDTINAGTALTSFVGHSGPNFWSFQILFSYLDAQNLSNDLRPTVLTQWGCWNTFYVAETENTMGHEFLLNGAQGAAAVLGASTLTEASHERALARIMYKMMFDSGMTLGEAVLAAKQLYAAEQPGHTDVILGWTLLGDPALVMSTPE